MFKTDFVPLVVQLCVLCGYFRSALINQQTIVNRLRERVDSKIDGIFYYGKNFYRYVGHGNQDSFST
jgi:hypothetical protein